MAYRIKVDKECCIGCGSCAAICPELFELGEDGKSRVKNEEVEEPGCAQQAAEACPASCITVGK
jgi:ferredoxin